MQDNTPAPQNISNIPGKAPGKRVAVRKPRKKPAAPKRLDVGVISERRLLDSKILLPDSEPHYRIAKLMLYALILGGLAGAAVLFYLNTRTPAPKNIAPQITIPQDDPVIPPAVTTTPTTSAETPPAAPVQVVEILSTPTNFLNVRKGPGTNFQKIAEAKPGEAYILVSQDSAKAWYQIRLADGSTGWITAQYARVK